MAADALLERFVAWGSGEENVRRLVLVGSRARAAPPDELADVDLQVYARSSEPYTRHDAWLSGIAPVWLCVRDEYRDGDLLVPTRLVLFEGGAKVDFAFYPAGPLCEGIRSGLPHRVLLDKDGLSASAPPAPSAAEFRQTVEEFWFEAYHVAKYLARGDFRQAEERDWATKRFLRRVIEWRKESGLNEELSRDEESWEALLARMERFRRVATGTAAELGFPYPAEIDRNVSDLILRLRRGDLPG